MGTSRNPGQLRHLWTSSLGVPSSHLPRHTLLGKTHQVIHLLTGAEKRVQLGTLISPLLAGMLPAAAQSAPLPRVVCPPYSISGLRGLRDTRPG